MAILVDEESRKVSFLYKLIDGVSPGSFGMHVASMCGINSSIVDAADKAAREYEHTSRMKRLLELTSGSDKSNDDSKMSLGVQSDLKWIAKVAKDHDDVQQLDRYEHGNEMQLTRLSAEAEEKRRLHVLKSLLTLANAL